MESKQKTKLALVGVAIVAFILLPLTVQVVRSLYSLSINRTSVPTENPLTVSDQSMWQEYIDSENGFSVLYPPEVYIRETPFEGYTTTFLLTNLKEVMDMGFPKDIAPRIQVFVAETPIATLVSELNEARNIEQFPEYSPIELNGYEAYQTKALDSEVIFTHTIIGNEEKSYLIEMFTIEKENAALQEIYERMLQSFEIQENG